MNEFNEKLKNEAIERGFLNWKEFKKKDPDLANKVRIEIMTDRDQVGLW